MTELPCDRITHVTESHSVTESHMCDRITQWPVSIKAVAVLTEENCHTFRSCTDRTVTETEQKISVTAAEQ